MKNFYAVLGIQPTASYDEVKTAFRNLAKIHHPDKGGDAAKFKEISEAYATLSNESKRREYNMRNGINLRPSQDASGGDSGMFTSTMYSKHQHVNFYTTHNVNFWSNVSDIQKDQKTAEEAWRQAIKNMNGGFSAS